MNRHRYDTTRTLRRRTSRPQPDERPYLIGVSGELAGRLFPLEGLAELAIGRTEDCEVRITLDEMVSRRHARLERKVDGSFVLHDLQSLNGTRVNGRDIEEMLLRRGDWVEVGEHGSFKFDYLSDQEREQRESGFLDGLTECWNRKCFDERLPELFQQALDRQFDFSLLMVDIDHFKKINDRFGHQAGDHALRQVALCLQTWLEAHGIECIACRYGGEEFALLLPRCDASTCAELAEGLRAAIAALDLRLAGDRQRVTASLGGATLVPGQQGSPEDLLRRADENLYAAKRAGRNQTLCS